MRSVVITGTSTGIGWGTTKVLIEHGFRVFGSVRKTSDANRLSNEFGDRFIPLLFDVTDGSRRQGFAAAVWLHGRAGELGGGDMGEQCLIATDLLRYLPAAMEECRALGS